MIILDFVRDAGLMTLTMTKLADDYGISQNVFGMVRQRLCSLDSSIYLKWSTLTSYKSFSAHSDLYIKRNNQWKCKQVQIFNMNQ